MARVPSRRGGPKVRASGMAFGAAALLGLGVVAAAPPVAGAATTMTPLAGSAAAPQALGHPAGTVAPASPVNFEVVLNLGDPGGAAALARRSAIRPVRSSATTTATAQWEAQYSPSPAEVSAAQAWLLRQGFTVGSVSADRITIGATGTAAQVEAAFDTQLGEFTVAGHTLREAETNLSVPTTVASSIAGVMGINQTFAQPASTPAPPPASSPASSSPASSSRPARARPLEPDQLRPAAPGGLRTCPPVQRHLRGPDPDDHVRIPVPRIPLGPAGNGLWLRGLPAALGLRHPDRGDRGRRHDRRRRRLRLGDHPGRRHPVLRRQRPVGARSAAADFTQYDLGPFDDQAACSASGWQTEEAIDVEAAHSLAPDAHIDYVGAPGCETGLFTAEQAVIDSGLANIVTNSWGNDGGDLLDDAADPDRATMTSSCWPTRTGMTVLFSSVTTATTSPCLGFSAAEYPASSPL